MVNNEETNGGKARDNVPMELHNSNRGRHISQRTTLSNHNNCNGSVHNPRSFDCPHNLTPVPKDINPKLSTLNLKPKNAKRPKFRMSKARTGRSQGLGRRGCPIDASSGDDGWRRLRVKGLRDV